MKTKMAWYFDDLDQSVRLWQRFIRLSRYDFVTVVHSVVDGDQCTDV